MNISTKVNTSRINYEKRKVSSNIKSINTVSDFKPKIHSENTSTNKTNNNNSNTRTTDITIQDIKLELPNSYLNGLYLQYVRYNHFKDPNMTWEEYKSNRLNETVDILKDFISENLGQDYKDLSSSQINSIFKKYGIMRAHKKKQSDATSSTGKSFVINITNPDSKLYIRTGCKLIENPMYKAK